jgi:hypothetical protein
MDRMKTIITLILELTTPDLNQLDNLIEVKITIALVK